MLVKNEMTRKVESVSPMTLVTEAARKMRELNVGALPVCDAGGLVGILTDRDITIRLTAEAKDAGATQVKEIMTSRVEWCFEDEDMEKVASKMERKKIRRLPVINHESKLVGMISISDIAMRGNHKTACEIFEKVTKHE